ncbi:hypothetical protein L208DRAFT_1293556 [Tricholoma matsutake]|nr:hypothetical protein L208DRAFT_1293556 [Tricholoma matsutake 945]
MDLADLDACALYLQVNAIECSTSKNYATGARDYINFCILHSLPLDPTLTTLSCYIAFSSQFITSAPKYLTGMQHFLKDLYPEFDDNHSHPLMKSTIQGSKKVRADPILWKLPLHLAHLQLFVNVADCTGSFDDLLMAVLLLCAFYGCHCMGELIQKNDQSLFDWRKIIKQASLCLEDTRAQYHLPYHKSDSFYRGTNVILTKQDVANPLRRQPINMSWHDHLHGARSALFLQENGSHPSRSWFDLKFFTILDRRYSGHSPWTGYATLLASLGLSESIIQAVGCWSSDAWKIYIRENPSIRVEQQLATIRL